MYIDTQNLVRSINRIEKATANLFNLESVLADICQKIQERFGYDFVALQLIRPDEPIIETVYGIKFASKWAKLSKHPLSKDKGLRDIQADIIETLSTEVIAGWDQRFDSWVFEKFSHHRLVRIFSPIIIARYTNTGEITPNWFNAFDLKTGQPEIIENYSMGECVGVRREFSLPFAEILDANIIFEPIGTLEAGLQIDYNIDLRDSLNLISMDSARDLFKLLSIEAPGFRQFLLPHVLETIVDNAVNFIKSDSATLHFDYNPNLQRYTYQVCAGKLDSFFLSLYPPRSDPDGLGRKAIRDNKPVFVPDNKKGHRSYELKKLHRPIFDANICAIAAFPLLIDEDEGVLYIHYHGTHWFSQEEIETGKAFSDFTINAIRHANSHTKNRDYIRQFGALHLLSQLFSEISDEQELLTDIANSLRNILAADLIAIWEYFETEEKFAEYPQLAGKLLKQISNFNEVATTFSLKKMLAKDINFFAENLNDDLLLVEQDGLETRRGSFLYREGIKSTAGILFKNGDEVVGIATLHYRRHKKFTFQDTSIMETFSSIAAMSMKHLRLLKAMADIEFITDNCEQIYAEIIKRAVLVTGANRGSISWVDENKGETFVLAIYPRDPVIDTSFLKMDIHQGIIESVIENLQPVRIPDFKIEPNYKPFFPGLASALCFPIVDNKKVICLINLESRRVNWFKGLELQIMKSLAKQALVAMKFCEPRINQ